MARGERAYAKARTATRSQAGLFALLRLIAAHFGWCGTLPARCGDSGPFIASRAVWRRHFDMTSIRDTGRPQSPLHPAAREVQASAAALVLTPAVEADTGAAPLRSLPLQRRASQSEPLAPRAALPASTSRPVQAPPGLHAATALPVKPESTEPGPGPGQALADKLLRDRHAARMGRMWGRMATDFAPLLTAYRAKLDKHANGAQLVEALFKATESARSMPTGVAQARHFRVKLHDKLPELNVLVWGSGIHSTLTLAKTDGADEIKRVATRLATSGKRRLDAQGKVTDMRIVPAAEGKLGYLLDTMEVAAKRSDSLKSRHRTVPMAGKGLRYHGAAAPLKEKLGQEFGRRTRPRPGGQHLRNTWTSSARTMPAQSSSTRPTTSGATSSRRKAAAARSPCFGTPATARWCCAR